MVEQEYRRFVISYPAIRMHSAWWTVNLCSNDPRLLGLLGNRVEIIDDFHSLEAAIEKAKRRADELLS
jgi:hypothetical protein